MGIWVPVSNALQGALLLVFLACLGQLPLFSRFLGGDLDGFLPLLAGKLVGCGPEAKGRQPLGPVVVSQGGCTGKKWVAKFERLAVSKGTPSAIPH